MIDPQCPHIKSSPPMPDILLSVRRIERFSVVTGPTAIMSIVAISSPNARQLGRHRFPENTGRSTRLRPMPHFCPGRHVVQDRATPKIAAHKASRTLKAGNLGLDQLLRKTPPIGTL